MRTISVSLLCIVVLSISVLTAICQDNNTTSVNQTIDVNNTTLENNTIKENQTISVNQTIIENITSTQVNTSQENQTVSQSVIRVGMTSIKPLNDLDRYGNRSINNVDMYGNKSNYNISAYSYIKPMHIVANEVKPMVDVGDRSPVREFYNASDFGAKTVMDLSVYNQSKPVTNLAGFPLVKVPSNIA